MIKSGDSGSAGEILPLVLFKSKEFLFFKEKEERSFLLQK